MIEIGITILLYVFCAGFIGMMLYKERVKRCDWCNGSGCGYSSCRPRHLGTAITTGIFWPIAIFAVFGMTLGAYLSDREKRAELRDRRKKEEHEMKMAEMKLNIALLKAQGIKADWKDWGSDD